MAIQFICMAVVQTRRDHDDAAEIGGAGFLQAGMQHGAAKAVRHEMDASGVAECPKCRFDVIGHHLLHQARWDGKGDMTDIVTGFSEGKFQGLHGERRFALAVYEDNVVSSIRIGSRHGPAYFQLFVLPSR